MANADNVALVIQSIMGEAEFKAHEEIGFNMGSYVAITDASLEDKSRRGCGTIACIAGHAYLLATSDDPEAAMEMDADELESVAADYLGLTQDEAAHLFYDLPMGHALSDITVDQAVDTLKRLSETGIIEWRLN